MGKPVLVESIENKILQVRGKRVMLDRDLAELYGVPTKALAQSVKRNMKRFPGDFMLVLTYQEVRNLRSQFVTSSWGGRRYLPYAFTQEGVAMLSGVLNSERAILVNIQIMRAFVILRRVAITYSGLKHKIYEMEKKYDGQFSIVFDAIRRLIEPPSGQSKRRIGFHP